MFKRRPPQTLPAVAAGFALGDGGEPVASVYLCTRTGRHLAAEELAGREVVRATASMPRLSSDTHSLFIADTKMKRHPPPGYLEIADRLVTIAEGTDPNAVRDGLAVLVFGRSATAKTGYDFTHQSDADRIHLTTAPLADIAAAAAATPSARPEAQEHAVEPVMHSIWRAARQLVRESDGEGGDRLMPTTVAVLAILDAGYSFAVGPSTSSSPIESFDEPEPSEGYSVTARAVVARLAADFARDKLTPQNLGDAGLGDARVAFFVTASGDDLAELLDNLAADFEHEPVVITAPTCAAESAPHPAQVAAWGAALAGMPENNGYTVNLAVPLKDRVSAVRRQVLEQEASDTRRRRLRAACALVVPLLFVLGLLAGWRAWATYKCATVAADLEREQARQAKLAEYIKWRQDANQQFAYYNDLAKKILEFRNAQPAMVIMLNDLDRLWPDSDWYVTGLATLPKSNNQIEIHGKSKNIETVRAFAKALELESDGSFKNILITTGDTSAGGAAAASAPITNFAQPPASQPSSGVQEWVLKATYSPPGVQGAPQAAPAPQQIQAPPRPPQTASIPPSR
jgi:hypothetical protein